MNCETFAAQYRVRAPRQDSCGDSIITGRLPRTSLGKRRLEDHSHLYEHDADRLGVCLLLSTARQWNFTKERLLAVGCVLCQDGHNEGTLTFDPENPDQAKAAIRATGVRYRIQLSDAERERRTALLKSLSRPEERDSSAQDRRTCIETTSNTQPNQRRSERKSESRKLD